jgi:hypothetical protein
MMRPVLGAAQAIGGLGEIAVGVIIAVGTEGLGAGLGVGLGAHGLDHLIVGVRTIFGEDAQTLTRYILTDIGKQAFGRNASAVAGLMDGLIPLGLGSAAALLPELAGEAGAVGLRGATMEATAARIELSESTAAVRIEASGTTVAARAELSESPQLANAKSMLAPAAESLLPAGEGGAGNLPTHTVTPAISYGEVVDRGGLNIGSPRTIYVYEGRAYYVSSGQARNIPGEIDKGVGNSFRIWGIQEEPTIVQTAGGPIPINLGWVGKQVSSFGELVEAPGRAQGNVKLDFHGSTASPAEVNSWLRAQGVDTVGTIPSAWPD